MKNCKLYRCSEHQRRGVGKASGALRNRKSLGNIGSWLFFKCEFLTFSSLLKGFFWLLNQQWYDETANMITSGT